jgi:hypothetical protein
MSRWWPEDNADRNLIVPAGGSVEVIAGLGVQLPYTLTPGGTGCIQGSYIGTDITGNVALSQGGLGAISSAFV